MKKTRRATQFKLTSGIGPRHRVCEQTVCAPILIYLKVFPMSVLMWSATSVVINVFIPVAFSRWHFGYATYLGGLAFFKQKQLKISDNKDQGFLLVIRSSES